MPHESDEQIRQLQEDLARRQYRTRAPQRIANTLSTLMARRGYAQLQSSDQREEAWNEVVGTEMAPHSRVGNIRRGVVEVVVCNSAVLQELTFRKSELVKKMAAALPDQKIANIRFRIGSWS